ncbi:MAG: non-canonical purine NTP pyrophosphatase [Thermoguttaceae bacterium]|jgi:XTP/dITP diphosphohydrolase
MAPLLVLGTANRHKGRELAGLLAAVGLELRTLADFPDAIEVPEDGETFAANAAKKAIEQARHLGHWVLADDSGLAVDFLGGRPGVLSARYAGPEATDAANNRKVLAELRDVPTEQRTARFVCHIVVADPAGTIRAESEAACRGRLLWEPRGNEGFGYDPLFEIVEYHQCFGQLSPLVKSYLSHRARAARAVTARLIELVDAGELA